MGQEEFRYMSVEITLYTYYMLQLYFKLSLCKIKCLLCSKFSEIYFKKFPGNSRTNFPGKIGSKNRRIPGKSRVRNPGLRSLSSKSNIRLCQVYSLEKMKMTSQVRENGLLCANFFRKIIPYMFTSQSRQKYQICFNKLCLLTEPIYC